MLGKHAIAGAKKRRKLKLLQVQEFVSSEISKNPFLTARQLQHRFESWTGASTSKSTVYRALHAIGLTHKQAHKQVHRAHQLSAIIDFCKRFDSAFRSGTLIALDEMGVHLGMRPRKGWAMAGRRLVASSSSMRYAKLSVIMAVSKHAVVGSMVSKANINKILFIQFLQGLDAPVGSTILMDNIAFHKSKEVMDLMQTRGFHPLYTLPYSPATNPIENLFSVIKRDLRNVCEGSKDVDVVTQHILAASQRAERHCCACYEKVSRMARACIETQDHSQFRQYDGILRTK